MPIPTMEAHQRVGVLRYDGCWSAVTADLPATPSALSDAERLVARVLPAWGIAVEHVDAVQTVTRSLVQAAVARETAAMVTFALVRHVDGIIVEICEAVTFSPGAVMLLSLPQPSGCTGVTTPRASCAAGYSDAESKRHRRTQHSASTLRGPLSACEAATVRVSTEALQRRVNGIQMVL
jgi:hypothetical protein